MFNDSGMEKSVAKYLENFGTNVNSFRIGSHNNNNNSNSCESKYDSFYDKQADYVQRQPSSSPTDDSNQSSLSIVVDEDDDEAEAAAAGEEAPHQGRARRRCRSTADESAPSDSQIRITATTTGRIFRPGIEAISPFTQKYHHFFLSPFLMQSPALKAPPRGCLEPFDMQDSPIDLSLKPSSQAGAEPAPPSATMMARLSGTDNNNKTTLTTTVVCELEKKNPLDLTLLPRCNPILG